jgi:hypothetical protein
MEEKNHITEANKIMVEQLEMLHAESKKEKTTAIEKALLSQAMVNVYKAMFIWD